MDYGIDGNESILRKGFLFGEYDEYHDLVNTYIIWVDRVRYIDWCRSCLDLTSKAVQQASRGGIWMGIKIGMSGCG